MLLCIAFVFSHPSSLLAGVATDSCADAPALPAKEKFHLFLLAGQSNMAGRGAVEAQDKVAHPRVLMLAKDGAWKPAVNPLHFDKSSAGVGLGRSFAIALAEQEKDKEIVIGLIPAACGGSPISTWQPGGYHGQTKSHPYDDAVSRTHRAMKDGALKGILWHQGESDSNPVLAATHKQSLSELIARFRKDLAAPKLPFVIGQLGQFQAKRWNEATKTVDQGAIGRHGADWITVNSKTGTVSLWDAKFRSSPRNVRMSSTFSKTGSPLQNAVRETEVIINDMLLSQMLSPSLRALAQRSILTHGTGFNLYTKGFGRTSNLVSDLGVVRKW